MGRPRSCSCGQCKLCRDRIRKAQQYAAMTPEERRAWKARKDRLKRYETDRRARRRHEAKYPEKAAARDAVQRALRSGRLVRQPCFVCGAQHGNPDNHGGIVKVEGHHPDYKHPLEVQWVCSLHHRPPWVVDRG